MKIAFLGLGSMGRPMAARLLRADHDIALWNRTPAKAIGLADEVGGRVADDPGEAVDDAELAITMLSDDEAVESVVTGGGRVLDRLPEGAVHASMSTIGPELSRRLERAHAERGQRYVAAPVFGRPDMAESGDLVVIAAGDPDAIEPARAAFDALGQRLVELGDEVERANVVKLAGNFLLAAAIEAMGEAFALVSRYGIDPGAFLDVVGGLFRSPIYEGYGGRMVEGGFDPGGFALKHGLKDVRYGLAAAEAKAVPMPLASAIRDRLLTGMARGWGDLDLSALGRVAADASGIER